jgi:hypothetical protein
VQQTRRQPSSSTDLLNFKKRINFICGSRLYVIPYELIFYICSVRMNNSLKLFLPLFWVARPSPLMFYTCYKKRGQKLVRPYPSSVMQTSPTVPVSPHKTPSCLLSGWIPTGASTLTRQYEIRTSDRSNCQFWVMLCLCERPGRTENCTSQKCGNNCMKLF